MFDLLVLQTCHIKVLLDILYVRLAVHPEFGLGFGQIDYQCSLASNIQTKTRKIDTYEGLFKLKLDN